MRVADLVDVLTGELSERGWSVSVLAARTGVAVGELESVLDGGAVPSVELVGRCEGLLGRALWAPQAVFARRWSVTASGSVSGAWRVQLALVEGARRELVEEFGLVSVRELARGVPGGAPEVARWVRQGRVFAVSSGGRRLYPGFQFDGALVPRPLLARILAVFGPALEGWELALWLTGASASLGGVRPVDVLVGDVSGADEDAVMAAARELAREVEGRGYGA